MFTWKVRSVKKKLLMLAGMFLLLNAVSFFFFHKLVSGLFEEEFNKVEQVEHRLVDFANLSRILGYGGLVHDFKNYVIRGSSDYRISDYLLKIEQDFVLFDQISDHLLSHTTQYVPEKRKQLQILRATVSQYKSQLEQVRYLKSTGMPINEIDRKVVVNDAPALKALEELQRLHRLETLKLLDNIQANAQFRQLTIIGGIFLVNVLIVLGLYHFFLRKVVIKPLEDMKRYTDLLDKHFVVSKTNLKGTITYVNERFCEISGYDASELLGHNHNMIRHPDTSKGVFQDLWDKITRGQVWSGILKNRRKNGEEYTVKTLILPLRDAHKRISEYLSLRVDISDQVEHEKALQIQTLKTECAFDHQESLVALVDQETHNIEYANQGFQRFFRIEGKHRLNSENAVSIHSLRVIPFSQFIQTFESEKAQGFNTGRDMLTIHLFQKTYVFKWMMADVMLERPMYVLSLTDVTQIENLKVEALAAKESQALFLANMSHEVRTPLNGILGFAEMLSKTPLDKEQAWYVDILVDSSHKLLSVVNDILDFSKLEKGEMEISPEVENIHVDLYRSLSLFAPVALKKAIQLNIQLSPTLPEHLKYDSLRVNQILTNLISNALKFTPEHGHIQVDIRELRKEGEMSFISFSVEDSGIGIAEDVQSKIFESFKQADCSTCKNYGGTGLGLAISNKLVHKMGGDRILIDSTPGKGSRFYFTLPLERVNKKSLAQEMSQLKVLLVGEQSLEGEQVALYLQDIHIAFESVLYAADMCEEWLNNVDWPTFNVLLILDPHTYEVLKKQCPPSVQIVLFFAPLASDAGKNTNVILDFATNRSHLYNLFLDILSHRGLAKSIEEADITQKILLAEDNAVNQKLMDVYLRKLNIEYDLAQNGLEAVKLYQAHPYAFILMDINMPIKGGVDALKEIREFERVKSLPKSMIFALTANVMKSDVLHYEDVGFDGHIPKPTKLENVRSAIDTFLAQKPRDTGSLEPLASDLHTEPTSRAG